MGLCGAKLSADEQAEMERSRQLDRLNEEDNAAEKKKIKLLLLGARARVVRRSRATCLPRPATSLRLRCSLRALHVHERVVQARRRALLPGRVAPRCRSVPAVRDLLAPKSSDAPRPATAPPRAAAHSRPMSYMRLAQQPPPPPRRAGSGRAAVAAAADCRTCACVLPTSQARASRERARSSSR